MERAVRVGGGGALHRASGASAPVRVHVKLDTGMGRLGTRVLDDAVAVAELVAASAPALELAGAMTHFASADEDPEFTASAAVALRAVRARAARPPARDRRACANSAATLGLPASHLDLVRCGIAVYGCDPMNQDPAGHGLEPALELTSYVAAVKAAAPGESAGYGRRWVAESETWVATVPIGYARRDPPRADQQLRGADRRPALPAGRHGQHGQHHGGAGGVRTPLRCGDRVTIIGADGCERVTAEELARRIGTINYEIVCGVSAAGAPRRITATGWRYESLRSVAGARGGRRTTRPGWWAAPCATGRSAGRPTTTTWRCSGDARSMARELARAAEAHVFALSEAFGVWRVVAHDRSLAGRLAARGRRVDRARPGRPRLHDQCDGRAARPAGRTSTRSAAWPTCAIGGCGWSSPGAFVEDPLRALRLVAAGLRAGLLGRAETSAAAAASAAALDGVAPERVFAELKRIVIAERGAGRSRPDGRGRGDRRSCSPRSAGCAASSRARITTSTCTSTRSVGALRGRSSSRAIRRGGWASRARPCSGSWPSRWPTS